MLNTVPYVRCPYTDGIKFYWPVVVTWSNAKNRQNKKYRIVLLGSGYRYTSEYLISNSSIFSHWNLQVGYQYFFSNLISFRFTIQVEYSFLLAELEDRVALVGVVVSRSSIIFPAKTPAGWERYNDQKKIPVPVPVKYEYREEIPKSLMSDPEQHGQPCSDTGMHRALENSYVLNDPYSTGIRLKIMWFGSCFWQNR